jgi:hypothetical protein
MAKEGIDLDDLVPKYDIVDVSFHFYRPFEEFMKESNGN